MQSLNHENEGYPLVSVLPGATLCPESVEVIYASGNQVWFRSRPSPEERVMLGNLAIRRSTDLKETEIAEVYKVIGANLRRRRKARRLSHAKLAEMIGFKNESSISRMESGQQNIAVHHLLALAKVFECRIDDFLEDGGNEGS